MHGAAEPPSWLETKGASSAMALATPPGAKAFALPCKLLVYQHGRIAAAPAFAEAPEQGALGRV